MNDIIKGMDKVIRLVQFLVFKSSFIIILYGDEW